MTLVETTQLAMGWSVKKSLMGKTVYNETGAKVGKVDDLIISPDQYVSYVIVGAGGFVGIGRHDVAIPVAQLQNQAGKLVLPGATKDSIKAMPGFDYATDTSSREQFVAAADANIAKAKRKLADLEKQSASAAADAKVKLDAQIAALKADMKDAEAKLAELKSAAASKWKGFEAGVNTAIARLRKSMS
jgi:sporulation protein YlmC with PRC-barrel domain